MEAPPPVTFLCHARGLLLNEDGGALLALFHSIDGDVVLHPGHQVAEGHGGRRLWQIQLRAAALHRWRVDDAVPCGSQRRQESPTGSFASIQQT